MPCHTGLYHFWFLAFAFLEVTDTCHTQREFLGGTGCGKKVLGELPHTANPVVAAGTFARPAGKG